MKTAIALTLATAAASLGAASLAAQNRGNSMNAYAERYIRLVLELGQHDADYVDAYYGPPELKAQADAAKPPLADIDARAATLAAEIEREVPPPPDELPRLRRQYVLRQLAALRARVSMLNGQRLSFDEESRALYDAVAPSHTGEEFDAVLAELEKRLPGAGSLAQRYEAFRSSYVIPKDRLDATFKAAIDGCRSRTLEHITLPPGESFTVEYVTNKSWSGYNWYQGNYKSLIQVNTDLPIYADRAIDLACHEGYPGHHVYNALLEKNLVRDRGWLEFSVYALFSPQSLIAEGTANYGIDVAFPRAERLEFERRVIFPPPASNRRRRRNTTRCWRWSTGCPMPATRPPAAIWTGRSTPPLPPTGSSATVCTRGLAPSSACASSTSTAATSSTTTWARTWWRATSTPRAAPPPRPAAGAPSSACCRRRGCRPD
jgi:hypothetical protein